MTEGVRASSAGAGRPGRCATCRDPHNARRLLEAGGTRLVVHARIDAAIAAAAALAILYERGARLFVPMWPGDSLARLAQAAFPDVRSTSMRAGTPEHILQFVRRERETSTS